MSHPRKMAGVFLGLWLVAAWASAAPPLCTTHFFDWYVVSPNRPLDQLQRHWTYRLDWQALGIGGEEIGNSVHYYEVQFRKIREAGFDGVHYEWHNNNPKPQFLEAAAKVGLPLAMFYDMEIRFHGRPSFITPTDAFADQVVSDVASFYGSVPQSLWLHDRNGKLPIVVYGYQFDRSVTDPQQWDRFYRRILSGIEGCVKRQVVLHWTNTSAPQQMYALQHFPAIQSYVFNEASGQAQANARSVTFVVHYDDLGVSFARQGSRGQRWIRNDIRYLQEALWLAKHTDPDLVFNYGWNELYEGEHLLPDDHWGTWRYEVASAMVQEIKAGARADLPRALILVDDFLPALHGAPPEKARMLRREMDLLVRLRGFVPQAEVALPGRRLEVEKYAVIFALHAAKDARQEEALAGYQGRLVFADPEGGAESPLLRAFTSQPPQPRQRPDLGPSNEFVVARRKVDIDLARFPMLSYRCRNSRGTVFHIRSWGRPPSGQEVPAWYETSPTDDRQTDGAWEERRVNLAEVARRAAGGAISRLTRLEIILDDLDENGDFSLDIDFLRLADAQGNIGWQEEFDSVAGWQVDSSFGGIAGARKRYGFAAVSDAGQSLGRMTLAAISSDALGGDVDEATRQIQPRDGVRVVRTAVVDGQQIPVVLRCGNRFLLNTYSPSEDTWAAFLPEALGAPLHRGVIFRSYSHTVTQSGIRTRTEESWQVIPEEQLPIDRIRMVAPPELDRALPFTLPASSRPLKLRVVRGSRPAIPFPDPGSTPPAITLQPGEVIELVKE